MNQGKEKQKESSRRWLVESLLDIMDEKNYTKISISEVAEHAQLSRRTFYRHFDSIDDVLVYYLTKISRELADKFYLGVIAGNGFEDFVMIYFEFWNKYKELLRLLQKNQLLYLLQETVLPNLLNSLETDSNENNNYLFCFLFGGIHNMLIMWVEDGMRKSPLQMKDVAKMISNHWNQ